MTQEDQDAIIGRTLRELRDTRERLAKLKAKASEFGDSFSTVAHHLRNEPQFLRLDGESTDERFVKPSDAFRNQYSEAQQHIPKKSDLDINSVVALVAEVRQCLIEEERLGKSLAAMGYKDLSL
jgi:hypothetical protein